VIRGLRAGEPGGAWRALVACIVTIVLASGSRASFAAFIQPIEVDLGLDRFTLSTAGAISALCYGLSLPIAGRLATRFGSRPVMIGAVIALTVGGLGIATAKEAWHLYVFAGILPGVGVGGAGNVSASVLLARWFGPRLGFATGVMNSAIPAGQALFVPLVAALIPVLGWRATYIGLGGMLAGLALPTLWMLAREPAGEAALRRTRERRRVKAGRDVWLVGMGFFGCGFTDQFVSLHLIALASDAGVQPLVAAGLLSLTLICGAAGSVISGPLADARSARVLLSGTYLTRAAALPLLLLVGSVGLPALGLFAVLFGLTFMGNQAPATRLVRDRYGVEAVGALMGGVGLAHQIGGALGIALGGVSVSLAGDYGPAIIVAAAVTLTGGLLQLLIQPAREARVGAA
jgi:predicted MFS family arabinose efflux permease